MSFTMTLNSVPFGSLRFPSVPFRFDVPPTSNIHQAGELPYGGDLQAAMRAQVVDSVVIVAWDSLEREPIKSSIQFKKYQCI